MSRLLTSLLGSLIGLCFYLTLTQPILANQVVFSDDFSTDLHQWQQLRGLPEDWQIKDGQLEAYLNNSFTISELIPTDRAWQADWQNLDYSLDFTPLEGVDRNFSFNVFDVRNWYEVHFIEGTVNLVKFNNGITPFDFDFPSPVVNGQTYHLDIIFHTGLVQVYLNHSLLAQQYDWTFTGSYGKIGLKVTTGSVFPTRIRFDNLQVTHITSDGEKLSLPLIKQTEAVWADQIYDPQHTWSQRQTIGNWGCALTSMVMILNYYGLQSLPDGQPINPATLNQWLSEQPDGYLYPGLINWLAITRLTYLLNQQQQTWKLEYTYQPNFQVVEKAADQLVEHQPVIIEIPDHQHFVTGIGYTGNHQDLYINDPSADFGKLSDYQTEQATARFFQPSHTDLSYLEIVHSPNVDVHIVQSDVTRAIIWQTISEKIIGEDGEVAPVAPVIELLAKPNPGEYQLVINRSDAQPYQLEVLAYDQTGNVTLQQRENQTTSQPMLIQFSKDGPSTISPSVTLNDLSIQLTTEAHSEGFRRLSVYYRLQYLTKLAQPADEVTQSRYLNYIHSEITRYQAQIQPETVLRLESLLDQLLAKHPP